VSDYAGTTKKKLEIALYPSGNPTTTAEHNVMDREGRKSYRVPLGDEYSLDVVVKTASGETFPGELLDITAEGAGTRFKREVGPTLAVGEPTTLTFTSARLRNPIKVCAKVRSRTESGSFRSYRYGFEFDEWQELQRRLSGEIHRLFNQRSLYRVEPDPAEPVDVQIRVVAPESFPDLPQPFEANGRVKNISPVGIAILVDHEVETKLAAIDQVITAFQLPASDRMLEIVSWIRNRRLQDDRVCYGLEFDEDRSKDFGKQNSEIVKYVRRRQLEEPPSEL
jgi:c-di-GMP-binding flagellar brake protein YcgR